MKRPKLLDLFCGAGGAAMGYSRAGFKVTGVDIKPQPHYPFKFCEADAFEYLEKHGHKFDVVHASPPCQRWSSITPAGQRDKHPDLIEQIRKALQATGKPYVIENVTGARRMLHDPVMLCGSMFGLNVWRHRYFEIYPRMFIMLPTCDHSYQPILVTGCSRRFFRLTGKKEATVAQKGAAMRIDWMTGEDLDESIPPAYTEFIGRAIMAETTRRG